MEKHSSSSSVSTDSSEKTLIYIADLGDYNAGYLTGDWIVLDNETTVEDVQRAIKNILSRGISDDSCHEEWAIHDYDNIPLSSEYPDLEFVLKVANLVREYSYEEVSAFLKHFDVSEIDDFEIRLLGIYDSAENYVTEVNDLSGIPENFLGYLDYEAILNDYELSGDVVKEDVGGRDFILFSKH